ncbi:MAG: asparaginase [Sciscionella sp.]
MYERVAEVWRGELVESVHFGNAVAVDAEGWVLRAVGSPDEPMYPRSANKPLQASAMVRAGLSLEPELLALTCASHAGQDFHVDGVRRILAGSGLSELDLRCTPDYPLDEDVRRAHLAAGRDRAPVYANCSGKHAAMLATCVHNGWSTRSYLKADHPLQRRIRRTIDELAGESAGHVAVDGCGAPLFGFSLTGLARSFAALLRAEPGSSEHTVAEAMRGNPEWVDGTGRAVTGLITGLPGAVAKSGAEGVLALAVPGGPAVAVKIADGAQRATTVVLIALLTDLGVDVTGVSGLAKVDVLGHGRPVGAVRPAAFATALTGGPRDE